MIVEALGNEKAQQKLIFGQIKVQAREKWSKFYIKKATCGAKCLVNYSTPSKSFTELITTQFFNDNAFLET